MSYDEQSEGSPLLDVDRGNTLFGVVIIAHFGLAQEPVLPPIFSHNRITYVHATPMGTEYSAFAGSFNRWCAEVARFYKFGAESDPSDDLGLKWEQEERKGFILEYKKYLNGILVNQLEIGNRIRSNYQQHLEEQRLDELRFENMGKEDEKTIETARKLNKEKVMKDESHFEVHKGIMRDLKNIVTHLNEYFGVRSIGGDQSYQFQGSDGEEVLQEGEKHDSVYFKCLRDCDHMPHFIHSLPKTELGYDLFTEECVAGFEQALELAKESKADLVNSDIEERNEKIDQLKETLRYVFSCRAKHKDGSWYWQESVNFDAHDIFQLFLCVSNEVLALTYGCEAFDDVQGDINESDREARIQTIMTHNYDTEAQRIFSIKGTPAGKKGRPNIPSSFRARGTKRRRKRNETHRQTNIKRKVQKLRGKISKRTATKSGKMKGKMKKTFKRSIK